MNEGSLKMRYDARKFAAEQLLAEVRRRGEWYGFDNWTPGELVDFVDDRIREHYDKHALGRVTKVGYDHA